LAAGEAFFLRATRPVVTRLVLGVLGAVAKGAEDLLVGAILVLSAPEGFGDEAEKGWYLWVREAEAS
jgi:hypothetical protein